MCPTVGKVSNFSPRGRQTVLLFNSLEAISLYLCRVRKFAILLQKSMGVLLMRVLYKLSKDACPLSIGSTLFISLQQAGTFSSKACWGQTKIFTYAFAQKYSPNQHIFSDLENACFASSPTLHSKPVSHR